MSHQKYRDKPCDFKKYNVTSFLARTQRSHNCTVTYLKIYTIDLNTFIDNLIQYFSIMYKEINQNFHPHNPKPATNFTSL